MTRIHRMCSLTDPWLSPSIHTRTEIENQNDVNETEIETAASGHEGGVLLLTRKTDVGRIQQVAVGKVGLDTKLGLEGRVLGSLGNIEVHDAGLLCCSLPSTVMQEEEQRHVCELD